MIAAIRIPTPEEIKLLRARLQKDGPKVRPRPQIALLASPEPIAVVSNSNQPRTLRQEDEHVRAWWAWKAWRGDEMLIMQYVRACCWMVGTTIEEVRGECRTSDIVAKRHAVIKSTCMRFPEISQSRMGKLFNRDHTVIGWILRCKTKNYRPDRKFSGAKNSQAKLTEFDIRAIRAVGVVGGPFMPLANQYGVTNQTISDIVNRKTWRHVL